ncbi:AfsR/SARP family transcriptional regulator [Actinophytocola sediminis]
MQVSDGVRWVDVNEGKRRSLLASLLIRAPGMVSTDQLVDELWGDSAPRTASTQVHGYVLRLRRMLGDREGRLLITVAGGYRLALADHEIDAKLFESRMNQGHENLRAGQPERAGELLREALALWRGPALCDVMPSAPVEAEANRLAEARLVALEARFAADIECGRHATLIGELHGHVEENPLREQPWGQLMLALYRDGRQSEALRAFRRVRDRLVDELGTEPCQALRELHQRILAGDPALGASAVERVPPSSVPLVCQLPAGVPDFIGRDEQADIAATLARRTPDGPPPVVVVFGGPGTGKSTLALHAARSSAPDFPHGQLYLDLTGTSREPREPAVMIAEMLHALGVSGSAVPDGLHARAALYRTLLADRRMLIVLDDAGHTDQVRWLTPPTGNSAVLVTSRSLLTDLPGARHIELDVLRPSQALELLTRIVGPDRVGREPEDAAAIVDSCGHLPLAIRIAAGKLVGRPAWSLRVQRERLEDESRRLSELRLGDLGVRASFDLSTRLLPEPAVRAFRLLGLLGARTFPGWVIDPLLGRDHADPVLDALVDANLVRLTCTDTEGQPWYRLHDLLRTYAVDGAETIPERDRRDAMERLLSTVIDLATLAVDRLPPSLFRPPPGVALRWRLADDLAQRLISAPLNWFDANRELLAGSVGFARTWGLTDLAWQVAVAAVPYYDHRGLYEDWRGGHQLALRAVHGTGSHSGEATLLRGLAQVQIYGDDYDSATANATRSLELFQRLGDKRGEGLAVAALGTIHRVLGRGQQALDCARQALDLVTAAGDQPTETQLKCAIGSILFMEGRHEQARTWFDEALDQCRRLGDRHREAVVLRQASPLYDSCGETDRADRCLQRAVDIFTSLDDDRCISYTLATWGGIHAARGDGRRAIGPLTRAADIFRRNGSRTDEAKCWELLGELALARRDAPEARRLLTLAHDLWNSFGGADHVGRVSAKLAELRELEGDVGTV